MSIDNIRKEQDQNTAKLVMSAFYKVADKNEGASAGEITKYLQDKFGDVWRMSVLTSKAEEALKRSAGLGFLGRQGDRYMVSVVRARGCCKKKRPRPCCCRPKRKRRPPCCCRPRPCCKRPPSCCKRPPPCCKRPPPCKRPPSCCGG